MSCKTTGMCKSAAACFLSGSCLETGKAWEGVTPTAEQQSLASPCNFQKGQCRDLPPGARKWPDGRWTDPNGNSVLTPRCDEPSPPHSVKDVKRDPFLAFWTSIETDTRKALIRGARTDTEKLHDLLRTVYEAASQVIPSGLVPGNTPIGDEIALPARPQPKYPAMRMLFHGEVSESAGYTAEQLDEHARIAVELDRARRATEINSAPISLKRYGAYVDGEDFAFGPLEQGPFVMLADVEKHFANNSRQAGVKGEDK
jgi:hypothetical protein